jgi:hypothetical protein
MQAAGNYSSSKSKRSHSNVNQPPEQVPGGDSDLVNSREQLSIAGLASGSTRDIKGAANKLLPHLYAAASGDGDWTTFVRTLGEAAGAPKAHIIYVNNAGLPGLRGSAPGIRAEEFSLPCSELFAPSRIPVVEIGHHVFSALPRKHAKDEFSRSRKPRFWISFIRTCPSAVSQNVPNVPVYFSLHHNPLSVGHLSLFRFNQSYKIKIRNSGVTVPSGNRTRRRQNTGGQFMLAGVGTEA